MLFKDLHWQRGTPAEAGTYLVFDQERQAVRMAVVTDLAPFSYRFALTRCSGPWPFRAYLGPLDQRPATNRWPRVAS